jgi:hypothetical protein
MIRNLTNQSQCTFVFLRFYFASCATPSLNEVRITLQTAPKSKMAQLSKQKDSFVILEKGDTIKYLKSKKMPSHSNYPSSGDTTFVAPSYTGYHLSRPT